MRTGGLDRWCSVGAVLGESSGGRKGAHSIEKCAS